MISTIFSGIPKGVSVRRLDDSRKAQGQNQSWKFSAWIDNGVASRVAYGNSIRGAIRNLHRDVTIEMK